MNRTALLRWSLFSSLGLWQLACGGTSVDEPDRGNAGGEAGNPTEGTAGGSGATDGAAASSHIGKPPSCTAPEYDPSTGLTRCGEGYRYRAEAVACTARRDEAGNEAVALECAAACGDEPHEVCASVSASPPVFDCVTGCLTDDECGDGRLCACDGSGVGTCVASSCRADRDCDTGYHCAQSDSCLPAGGRFDCQRADDQCSSRQDCDGTMCLVTALGRPRTCYPGSCGRPFLVEALARVAPVVENGAWAVGSSNPRLDHLTGPERAALAQHWAKMGQMEHASIAAFARFSLQLLSLGAPPDLLEACTQALIDESAHTKLCFGLASAYAGRAVGPGPLDVSGSLEIASLGQVVELVIAEGCFGETSAALEALESGDAASDPVIVAAYSQIARDEQRHAELAFRFVRWAGALDASVVRACIARAVADDGHPSAVREVVVPCLQALLPQALAA